ncbi:MAG: prolyl oligopeptidase family serine peptidase [Deltaproteobacteria bacterium]|nr:prolyl oligopeptidase family serine peptidase [Deltaproteobacteria bacterium]
MWVWLLSWGCGASPSPEGTPVPYSLGRRPLLPFPSDEVLRPDPTTPTGLRMALRPQGENLGDVDEALFLLGDAFVDGLGRLDGWSTLGPAFAPIPGPVDEATVPGHFLLVDLEAARIVPTFNRVIEGTTSYAKPVHWLMARPRGPLSPKTRHAIVLLSGLVGADGVPFARAPGFADLLEGRRGDADPEVQDRAKSRLQNLGESLALAGVDLAEVLSAEVYTTLSVEEESLALVQAFREAEAPVLQLDADGDGAPDVYLDPLQDPRGNVPRGQYPSVRALLRARFTMPNFRLDRDGPMVFAEGQPVQQGTEDVELILTVPKGAGPFPVVVFHHGLGGHKETALEFAEDLSAQGFAVVAIDAALHGFRTERPGNAGTRFLNITAPALIGDNFRQAETDQAYLARVIEALAAADLFGDGSRVLDPTRRFYFGESLGGILGGAVLGLEPSLAGGVLAVGGGTLLEFFDRVLSGFELQGFPTQLFTTVAQTLLDRGDPSNYARLSREKQILLSQAMEDDVVPAAASVSLARAMELPLLAPGVAPVADLPVMAGPLARRGWAQFSPAGHELFQREGRPNFRPARDQAMHFLARWRDTGQAELTSPQ